MARLLSVNVGLPRDILWRGRTVHTGIWKAPVSGRCRVGRLNVEGDGQGDLAGHGGEQRAVFAYQIESYRYWQERLGRSDFVYGQFGENFTIEGLADDEVCIGDRYRIGAALLEVTQPRVTCYRVGIRMDHPQMPALLTSSGRPGFYLRVLEEGDVAAGDPIALVARGPQGMTVTKVNALLYSSSHPRDQLERALRIPALSQGWRGSFETMLRSQDDHPGATGNPGLAPAAAAQTATPGFRPLRVARIEAECADVLSLTLQPTDGRPLTAQRPGQFVVLRLHPTPDGPPLLRSYSLSGPACEAQYRVSVKLEPNGAAGTYLHAQTRAGDVIDVSQPRGAFTLLAGDGPVVLLSAGIGATPVMAMLHALAASATPREIWWLHGARDGAHHVFAAEARGLLAKLARGHGHVWYSRPAAEDRAGADYDTAGRLGAGALADLDVPRNGDFYICGPSGFMGELTTALGAWGVAPDRIHSEVFAGGPTLTPGIVDAKAREPHPPDGPAGAGPLVSFARSGLAVPWRESEVSLLELAEACDVPVRWSCRSGVCHNCESGLISGVVAYEPDPLDPPATGNLLLCCARPRGDVVLDI
ncbi:MAG TPA: MOSC and FAD-binding oxidoreductase domain-containing protein [Caulobacteraceae bacterium]|nr:MOSC and FAD-binding oxidoreductase domain-containing protein [Caulobacteraceae bacterium]